MRVVFFGSSQYCFPVLEALHKNFDLVLVVTRPASPVKLWAQEKSVPVLAPATLKKDTSDQSSLISQMSLISPNLAIVSDYGLIIPEAIFSLPRLGTFNIHFSKLPDLRGPSPVQFTLLRGDQTAWITLFSLEKTLDTGPILWQKEYPTLPDDTASILYTRLFAEVAKELPAIDFSGPLTPQIGKPTFCKMLTRADGFVEWSLLKRSGQGPTLSWEDLPKIQREALSGSHVTTRGRVSQHTYSAEEVIYNFFRAVTPWPGLWSIYPNGKRVKILKCHPRLDSEGGGLVLDQIQFEGKKPQPASQGEALQS